MKLEDQVCSFELAKRLKELGVKQDSVCHYYFTMIKNATYLQLLTKETFVVNENAEIYSAFTVAELGEMLPSNVTSGKIDDQWFCRVYYDLDDKDFIVDYIKQGFVTHKEADARANMLIWLIEQE